MGAQWMPNVCPMGARWVPDGRPMGARWVLDECPMGVQWMPNVCQMGGRCVPNGCLMGTQLGAYWMPDGSKISLGILGTTGHHYNKLLHFSVVPGLVLCFTQGL